MIVEVNEENLDLAARIHAESWQDSHRSFCTPDFVAAHDQKHQRIYLEEELHAGKQVYMLIKDRPVGIVSIKGNLIENLYVLPEAQGRGFGMELLLFAIEKCDSVPCLWILDNNQRAQALYERHGFRLTGRKNSITDTLSELEMKRTNT